MEQIDQEKIGRYKLAKAQQSPMGVYKSLVVGDVSFSQFLLYEFLTSFIGPITGGLGFYLRKKLYPKLFKKTSKGMIIGRNVVIRHPQSIQMQENVTIDDNCLIDARGSGEKGIQLDENVIINRNCMVQSKSGPINIGKGTSIGCNSVIISMSGVEIGEGVITAGNCYLSAGIYHHENKEVPIMEQEIYTKGPIKIGKHAWIGTSVTILDGVSIGEGAIIGAGAVVTKDVPPFAIAAGIPAKVVRMRC